jgi:ABC-2 type transport system permease protein
MSALYILWLRELKKYVRSRTQIVASLGQPLLYLLVLGFGFGPVFQRAGEGSYLQFVAPGVIGMMILFASIVSGMSLLWDRQFGFLKKTLVAPVPRLRVMIGRAVGGATVAMLQGTLMVAVCIVAGFRPTSVIALPLAALYMLLTATVFTALGIATGASLQNMQGFKLVMTFVVMPVYFLSGALSPLNNLPKALAALRRVDPLSYGVDGLRAAFIGRAHFGVVTDLAVLALSAVALLGFGAWRFSKIEI